MALAGPDGRGGNDIAQREGIAESGYRLVMNMGRYLHIFHLHCTSWAAAACHLRVDAYGKPKVAKSRATRSPSMATSGSPSRWVRTIVVRGETRFRTSSMPSRPRCSGPFALAVATVHHQHVCPFGQKEDLVAHLRIAGVGHRLVAKAELVAKAGSASRRRDASGAPGSSRRPAVARRPAEPPRRPAGSRRRHCSGRGRPGRPGPRIFASMPGGPTMSRILPAGREVQVLQEEEGEAQEVVAVEVADEHDPDVGQRDAQALEVG